MAATKDTTSLPLSLEEQKVRRREKESARVKAWRAAHPEEARARDRAKRARRLEKVQAYDRLWKQHARATDPSYQRAVNRAYWHRNKAARKAARAAWGEKNTEYISQKNTTWRILNRDKERASKKAYYLANRERILQARVAYKQANPDKINAHHQRRRAQKASAPRNDLTAAQWQEIKAAYDHRCVYCGRKMQRLTMDHITPLVQGGAHTASNIVPACASCNSRKNAGPPLTPVQPLLLTVAQAKKKKS